MINAAYESTVGNLKNTKFNHDQGREAFFFEKYINLRYFSGEVYRHLLAQATAKLSTAEMARLEQERGKQRQEECSASKPSSNEGVGKRNKKKRPKKEDEEKKRQAILELKAARKLLEDQEAQEAHEGKLRKKNPSSRPENLERSVRHERPLKKSSSSRSLFDSDSDEDRHVRKSEKKENSMKKSSSQRSLFGKDDENDRSTKATERNEKSMRKSSSSRSLFDNDCDVRATKKSPSRRDFLRKQGSRQKITRRSSSKRDLMNDDSADDESHTKSSLNDGRDYAKNKTIQKSSSGPDLSRSSSKRSLF